MSGHTATPWRNIQGGTKIVDAAGMYVASTRLSANEIDRDRPQENAAFIVAACNSHAELTEALKGATIAANIAGASLKEKDAKIEVLSDSHADLVKALEEINGAMRFVLAFYEPGQRYLDTNAWKSAEAGARDAHQKATAALATLTARKVG